MERTKNGVSKPLEAAEKSKDHRRIMLVILWKLKDSEKLAAFQRKALPHAISSPTIERAVNSILPLALSNGFQLVTPFPQWHRRGLPVPAPEIQGIGFNTHFT
ncbi:putative methyltransferase NSUN5 [Tripterygium wilfordii]|uniref:Putative methyltransferase NSUN5 n=1 Tax=Tripterygium wilfordii TaxID=458696 RepID=A0A7J7DA80_TRIWF|nr:putative methyltransferase NSUN5 [Tripterygium wilfordii]